MALNNNKGFKLPMDWATDEQLVICRRELGQSLARDQLNNNVRMDSHNTISLNQVEIEMKLRGIA